MKKRKIGNELQTFVTKLSVNKLLNNKYGNRRFHKPKINAKKGKPAEEARGVVIDARNYMGTYLENSIDGREELRVDLSVQLRKNGLNKQAKILDKV